MLDRFFAEAAEFLVAEAALFAREQLMRSLQVILVDEHVLRAGEAPLGAADGALGDGAYAASLQALDDQLRLRLARDRGHDLQCIGHPP